MNRSEGNASGSSASKGTIVLLTDLYGDYQKQLADPLRICVNTAGYGLVVVAGAHVPGKSAASSARRDRNYVYEIIKSHNAHGIVMVAPSVCYELGSVETEQFIAGYDGLPMVVVGKSIAGRSCVMIDTHPGMRECMDHLLQAPENQRFAFLGGVQKNSDSIEREKIFRQSLLKADKKVDEELFVYGEFIAARAYEATIKLLERRRDIDVIVCANDESAQGAIYALEHMGLSVPDDVRVTGFDNHSLGTSSRPTISSVTQPQTEIARCAAETLLLMIETRTDFARTQYIDTRFVSRESSACKSQRMQLQSVSEEPSFAQNLQLAESIHAQLSRATTYHAVSREELVQALSQAAGGDARQASKLFKNRLVPNAMTRHDVVWWQNLAAIIENSSEQISGDKICEQLQLCLVPSLRLMNETFKRWRVRQEYETIRLLQIYEQFLIDISATDSLQMVCAHLHTWLAKLSIDKGFFAVYTESGKQASATASLACCHFSDRDVLPEDTEQFATSELLPATLQHHLRQGLLVMHSISADGRQFGYLLIDPTNIDSSKIDSGKIVSARLDAVVDGLGNAMLHIHQNSRMKKHADALETANKRLSTLANLDVLTQLPNRNYFQQNLQQVLVDAHRKKKAVALAFIDLDGFKMINDSLGHIEGDCLLSIVAQRLLQVMGPEAMIARLGGDEFTVIFRSEQENAFVLGQALASVADILTALAKPYQLTHQLVNVSCSIGVAIYPNDARDRETLLKKADAAMYHAKSCGKNCMRIYTPDLDKKISWQLEQDQKMRRGLVDDEFSMVFQPKYCLTSDRIVGVEALLRWYPEDNRGNPRLPSTFVPVAEKTGFIVKLDEFVLDSACEALSRWQQQGRWLPVAVNVSALHLYKPDFVDWVADCIARYKVNPRLLEIEITESAAMGDIESSIRQLAELQKLGVSVAIDDFGVGYSSLAYLKRLPIDTLKIDQSFLQFDENDLQVLAQDAAIAKAIIDLGRSMKYKVIAEGIEFDFQKKLVSDLGAHQGQGYLFSRPLSESDLNELLLSEPSTLVI